MIEISKANHLKILNASLNKIYNQARIKGKLESVDLYIFNVLFNYISTCETDLTNEQIKKLECIYRILYNTSEDICKVSLTGARVQHRTKFVAPPKSVTPITPVVSKVYYWQEPTPVTEYPDIVEAILNDNYLDDKPFTTKTLFEFGIDIPLTHIGRVAFAFDPSFPASSFLIKDFLGNDITHAFTKTNITSLDIVLFTSDFVYAYGNLNVHIIETPGDPSIDIFNNVFNNIFV
jgi:hypothetical protein